MRRWTATRRGLLAGALALPWAGDVAPARSVEPCPLPGAASARVYEGSRLFIAGDELALVRGRALACRDPLAARVLEPLSRALRGFPLERLHAPLAVHVDPRLPSREAPLAGIEVHVSSRELLVRSAALDELPAEAWRHELLHALAPQPGVSTPEAKRLWLTLEEALVTRLVEIAPGPGEPRREPTPPRLDGPRPVDALLASPAYDPHPLAAGLVRELRRETSGGDAAPWLDCLGAPPSGRSPATPAAVFRRFAERCPAPVREALGHALARWWPAPEPERQIPIASLKTRD
jgi:hypothetical protein